MANIKEFQFSAEEVDLRVYENDGWKLYSKNLPRDQRVEGKVAYSKLLEKKMSECCAVQPGHGAVVFTVKDGFKKVRGGMSCYVKCSHDERMPVSYDIDDLQPGQRLIFRWDQKKCATCRGLSNAQPQPPVPVQQHQLQPQRQALPQPQPLPLLEDIFRKIQGNVARDFLETDVLAGRMTNEALATVFGRILHQTVDTWQEYNRAASVVGQPDDEALADNLVETSHATSSPVITSTTVDPPDYQGKQ